MASGPRTQFWTNLARLFQHCPLLRVHSPELVEHTDTFLVDDGVLEHQKSKLQQLSSFFVSGKRYRSVSWRRNLKLPRAVVGTIKVEFKFLDGNLRTIQAKVELFETHDGVSTRTRRPIQPLFKKKS